MRVPLVATVAAIGCAIGALVLPWRHLEIRPEVTGLLLYRPVPTTAWSWSQSAPGQGQQVLLVALFTVGLAVAWRLARLPAIISTVAIAIIGAVVARLGQDHRPTPLDGSTSTRWVDETSAGRVLATVAAVTLVALACRSRQRREVA
jgi:uncharacterized membrane protein YciS (DUF1049 family)